MNTSNLKSYAPQARKDFIAAVTGRANLLGLSEMKGQLVVAEARISGDLVMIAGRPWPVKVNEQRNKLIARLQQQGFGHTVEAVAYAWFNRLAALRYMELHDYLGHGRRVLSNPQGGLPEMLTHALDLAESNALPGLSADTVRELKLANQDPELYRLILIAQCNALHQSMPFLFEQLGDETELLLPENLLLTDSVVAKLVQSIPEEDWKQIEIIGWLYQFYISEKKDQVIGKVVQSEDIPAATQLFTPNWIVKYMVQNSLGAQWLATYPDSPLKARMAYYIEPAVQTDEVNAQLAAITPSTLDPEELTLLDPACGSGHILVEAYDLFKAIYLERGYRERDVAQLILEKNLFGLDIDERAAQLTSFALMMKGRADDRRLFDRALKLNVIALLDSTGLDEEGLTKGVELAEYGLRRQDLTELKRLFEHATTFGSLIQVPEELARMLPALKQFSEATSQDLFLTEALKRLGQLVQQAVLLAREYDAVAANPPYMGSKAMNGQLKKFAKEYFPKFNSDLFSVSAERFQRFAGPSGFVALMTPFTWMFLKSYQALRDVLLQSKTLQSLIQPEYHAFFDSAYVPVCTFVTQNCHTSGYNASFIKLSDFYGADLQPEKTLEAIENPDCGWMYRAKPDDFTKIPGSPLAYWVGDAIRQIFSTCPKLESICDAQAGLSTTDNETFLRLWWEISKLAVKWDATNSDDAKSSGSKWFPHNKGGQFRRWSGNQEYVVDWEDDGRRIKHSVITKYPYLKGNPNFVVHDYGNYFQPTVSWSEITSGPIAFRHYPAGLTFSNKGMSAFPKPPYSREKLLSLCNSNLITYLCKILNPSLSFGTGNFYDLPAAFVDDPIAEARAGEMVESSRTDWDAYERSWDFQCSPLLTISSESSPTLEFSYSAWITENRDTIAKMKRLEEGNNRLFIDAYGLAGELAPDVPLSQITLTVNPAYRYGGNLSDDELWTRFRQDTMEELISYAVGCMMGRYSLDAPGLIYAHRGNIGFDASRYTKFPADADGIVPVTGELWFEDEATLRVRDFLLAVWPKDSLEQNMVFLAENLGRKASESAEQAIRRYMAEKFFKDHLQTYKKRPIYWLFSSGKQGAFQALVYLHRYNAGTLSRLRAEYVVPLTGKIQSKIEALEQDIAASSSTAQRNKLTKQLEKLRKQHLELLAYDEQLRHYADQRITLDLDDGVKVNYGKFGDLLADVKSVVGKQEED